MDPEMQTETCTRGEVKVEMTLYDLAGALRGETHSSAAAAASIVIGCTKTKCPPVSTAYDFGLVTMDAQVYSA